MLQRNIDDGNNFGIWNRHRKIIKKQTNAQQHDAEHAPPQHGTRRDTATHTTTTQTQTTGRTTEPRTKQPRTQHTQLQHSTMGKVEEVEPLYRTQGRSTRVEPWLHSQGEEWQSHPPLHNQRIDTNTQATTRRHQHNQLGSRDSTRLPSVVRRVSHGDLLPCGDRGGTDKDKEH